MKAIIQQKYGSLKDLFFTEVPTPEPKSNKVRIKIHCASVNSWDWDMLRGYPLIARLVGGWIKPKHQILGIDVAGRIEAVGI